MSFLQKSYRDYSKDEKSALVTTSYEGSDDEEEFKTVPKININDNSYNVFSDSKGKRDEDEAEENVFDDDINKKVKATQDHCQC